MATIFSIFEKLVEIARQEYKTVESANVTQDQAYRLGF